MRNGMANAAIFNEERRKATEIAYQLLLAGDERLPMQKRKEFNDKLFRRLTKALYEFFSVGGCSVLQQSELILRVCSDAIENHFRVKKQVVAASIGRDLLNVDTDIHCYAIPIRKKQYIHIAVYGDKGVVIEN